MSLTIYNQRSFQITSNLVKLGAQLAISNERMLTGKKVNRASDNPSAIVALTEMKASMAAIDAKTTNGQRLSSMFDTADGSLSEVSDLLASIEENVIAASDSGATADEKAAYQASIDSAIEAIDNIVGTTNFNGAKLLDGSKSYTVNGVNSAILTDIRINQAGTTATSSSNLTVTLGTAGAATLSTSGFSAVLAGEVRMTVAGPAGSHQFIFAAGTGRAGMAAAIVAQAGNTGVTASNTGGEVVFATTATGSDKTMSIEVTSGSSYIHVGGGTTYESATGTAPAVTVNGSAATIDNNYQVTFNTGAISGTFSVKTAAYGVANTTTFNVSGNGGNVSLGADPTDKINFGLNSLDSSYLGNAKLGYLSSLKSGGANDINSGNFTEAQDIAEKAVGQIGYARGRVGAVKAYSIDSVMNSLSATREALASSVESIEDLDYAEETANNTRLQLMIEVGSNLLNTFNSTLSNSILDLLTL